MRLAPGMSIIAEVAAEHGVNADTLIGRIGKFKLQPARRQAMRRIRDELGYSFPRIGRLFGRHHASIIWALQGGRRRRV